MILTDKFCSPVLSRFLELEEASGAIISCLEGNDDWE